MNIQASDLPSGYERVAKGSGQKNAQECLAEFDADNASVGAQMTSLGLQSCYSISFEKKEGDRSNDVSSGTIVFPDAAAASQAMLVLRSGLADSASTTGGAQERGSQDIPVTGLGDEAPPGFKFVIDLFGQQAAVIFYVWRDGNVVSFFGGSDALGDMDEQSILETAKTISSRAPS